MTLKWHLRTLLLISCMTLGILANSVRAQEVPLVTGDHWVKSTEETKKAYLVGVANIVHLELAYGGANQASDTQSILPRMVRGLKGQSLDSVREALNKWYAANPDKLQRPVIETLWFEMVVPGLKSAS